MSSVFRIFNIELTLLAGLKINIKITNRER